MKRLLLLSLIVIATTLNSFASDIKNAKIGSTIISSWNIVGHAGIVVNEYINDLEPKFIIGSHSGGVRYDSYFVHLFDSDTYEYDIHLGHFRAAQRNYTFNERKDIKKAARRAVNSDTGYEFINLYTYDWDYTHINNVPYNITTIPTDFRCDGLAEWATEIGMHPQNANMRDGFYPINLLPVENILAPYQILNSPKDTIGTPAAPELSLTDTHLNATFSPVSGAWSNALYTLYRTTYLEPSTVEVIYCGSDRSYSDIVTDDMEGEYFYYLKVGERTASCETMFDFLEFSEYSSVVIKKECKSSELFEVVSQINEHTKNWRVTVRNRETNKTQEDVYPFNLDGNGSLYQLDSGKWLLASCGGSKISETWEGQGSNELLQIDNPQKETISGENLCPSPKLFEIVSHTNQNTIDWRVSVQNKETNETYNNVYPFNLNGSLYPLENGELVIASCGGTEYTTEWLGQNVDVEFYKLDNSQHEIIKSEVILPINKFYMKYQWEKDFNEYYYLRLSLQQFEDKDFTIPLSPMQYLGGARMAEWELIQGHQTNQSGGVWESSMFFGLALGNVLQKNNKSLDNIERLEYRILQSKFADPYAPYYTYYVEFEVIFK